MDTYGTLRAFADSWFLIAMFIFFISAVVWASLPSLRKEREDAANIPFRDEIENRDEDMKVNNDG